MTLLFVVLTLVLMARAQPNPMLASLHASVPA
jgi:hypothetical protein